MAPDVSDAAVEAASGAAPGPEASPIDELVIEPNRPFAHYWRDLWRYRELFYILSWRDVKVRYKQTVAGVAWAVIQPVVTMTIMVIIFSRVARLPSDAGAPYPLMVFAAMLPWQFFATALSGASQSIVSNAGLVSKVYFPRLIIPASPILVALIDTLVAGGILGAMMVWYRVWPTWHVIAIPGLVLLAIMTALGPALIATALIVRYRDVRFLLPFIIQIGQFVSPVAYSTAVVRDRLGERLFMLYSLNPLVGVIEGFRWAVLGGKATIYWPGFATSVGLAALSCGIGIGYFRRTERRFADLI